MNKKIFLLLGGLLLLSACQGGGDHKPVSTDTHLAFAPSYPEIALFYKRPSDQQRQGCEHFAARSAMHNCLLNQMGLQALTRSLSESQQFYAVQQTAVSDTPYQLLVSVARKNIVNAKELSDAALFTLSLGLVPINSEVLMDVEAVLTWQKIPIAIYHYEMPWRQRFSILSLNEHPDKAFAQVLSDRLLADMESDKVFAEQTLYSVLNASNYDEGFSQPFELGDYVFEQRNLRPDPLLGLQLRYQHREFSFDKLDVFVYPIRYTEWQDTTALIDEELEKIQSELTLLKDEGLYKDIEFSASEKLQVGGKYGQLLHSALTDAQGVRYRVQTAIFIKEDKFVTLRASNPMAEVMPDIGEFWRLPLQAITPPSESDYMSQLRRSARNNTANTK